MLLKLYEKEKEHITISNEITKGMERIGMGRMGEDRIGREWNGLDWIGVVFFKEDGGLK